MAEPLKDKIEIIGMGDEYFKVEDIISAVEWLKKSLKDKVIWKSGYNEQATNELIDQAFPDITEKDLNDKV